MLIKDTCNIAAEIMNGDHDANLDWIVQAAQARKKNLYRKGSKVRLVGTKNPALDGQLATVIQVNSKRISVGVGTPETTAWGTVWSVGEYNVPPSMLEIVS